VNNSTSFEDPTVGSLSTYLPPLNTKDRIAVVPVLVNKNQTDPDRKRFVEQLAKQMLTSAGNITFDQKTGNYSYARLDQAQTHYQQGIRYFLCKKTQYEILGRTPTCCLNGKGQNGQLLAALPSYVTVIIRYEFGPDGNPLPGDTNEPFPNGAVPPQAVTIHSWPFRIDALRFMKNLKAKYPLISNDFIVSNETPPAPPVPPKPGTPKPRAVLSMEHAGPAAWLSWPKPAQEGLIAAVAEKWLKATRDIGVDLSIEEIDQMFGVSQPNQGSPAVSTSQDMSALLDQPTT